MQGEVACRFGLEVVQGLVVALDTVHVLSPAGASGFVTVSLEGSGGFSFETFDSLFIGVMYPLVLSMGSPEPFVLEGLFREGGFCNFGGGGTEAFRFISSRVVHCQTPVYSSSESLAISSPEQQILSVNPIDFQVGDPIRSEGLSITSGPTTGGSTVTVTGQGFLEFQDLGCKFGTLGPVSGTLQGDNRLVCVSPAHIPAKVDVRTSVNRAQFSDPVDFEYQEDLKVTGVVPRSGVDMGSTPVFVMGSSFVNSTSLSCRFGKKAISGIYLTDSTVLCISPPQPTSNVFLEVSNNGLDYTDDRFIFHYDVCPPGMYCPDGEMLQCPKGTYCPGHGNYNFTMCPPGMYQPYVGQESCLPAPVGFIAPDFGLTYAKQCPRGAICDTTGLISWEKLCPPGHFCLEGTRTGNFSDFSIAERPLPCPFGYYCGAGVTTDQTIANNFTTPQPCHAGYLCEPGSHTPQGSGPCPPGHYCPPGQMLPCPPRTYCPDVANTEPKPCMPGSYNQEYGQAQCKQCPLGTICPGFTRLLPQKCPPGFVCDVPGLPSPNLRCPRGHFCLENTLTVDPLSSLDEPKLLRSAPIQLDIFSFRPKPCLPATFCMEGTVSNVTVEGDFTQPQPCKEGSFCEWATSDKTPEQDGLDVTDVSNAMNPCPPGHYCPKGTYIPIPAPRGSFARGEGNSQPALCLPGTYTHYEGFESCLNCPAGYETPRDGTFKPEICEAGAFRSLRDSVTCRKCPMGTWSPYTGLTDEALCTPCNPGIVCGIEGMANNKPYGDNIALVTNPYIEPCEAVPPDASCYTTELQPLGKSTLCPEGYVCDARTSVAVNKCPDGYFCGYGTSAESQFMNKCPEGYYCPEGSAASSRFQFPCLKCHFCPEGTGVILPRCPEGTESEALATNVDDCTADGITFWQIQPLRQELLDFVAIKEEGNSTDEGVEVLGDLPEGGISDTTRRLLQLEGISIEGLEDLDGLGLGVDAKEEENKTTGEGADALLKDLAHCLGDGFEILNPQFVYIEEESDDDDKDDEEDTGPRIKAVDAEGTPLVKYSLPRFHIARLTFDFRDVAPEIRYGEHFEVSVFASDKVDKVLCEKGTPEHKKVPCPPWNEGDGINRKTMGEIQERLNEDKCPASTDAIEMPFWFSRKKDNAVDGEYIDKHSLIEIHIMALEDIQFRVEMRMLHGLYQGQTRTNFLNTMCMDVLRGERASDVEQEMFAVVMTRDDDVMLPLNVPLMDTYHRSIRLDYGICTEENLDPSCRFLDSTMLLSYNASKTAETVLLQDLIAQAAAEAGAALGPGNDTASADGLADPASVGADDLANLARRRLFWNHDFSQPKAFLELGGNNPMVLHPRRHLQQSGVVAAQYTANATVEETGDPTQLPDIIEEQEKLLQDASVYWKGERNLISMTYLPYFSACRNFDSFIHLYQLLETPYTRNQYTSYGKCTFVDPEETKFISQWAPQEFTPTADECEISFECLYEEDIQEAAAVSRWYEFEGDPAFYLSENPEPPERIYEASILATDDTLPPMELKRYDNAITKQEMIPVGMGPAEDGAQVAKNTVPKKIEFEITYFQRTKYTKRIISGGIGFDEYQPAKKHDGTYTLTVKTGALNWFDLLNAFAYDMLFYFMLFLGLGALAVSIVALFWTLNRLFTTLEIVPKFRFVPYLKISMSAPFVGTILSMIPFFIAQTGVRGLITNITFFDAMPMDLDNLGKNISDEDLTKARNGRMATSFMVISMYMLQGCSKIMIPQRKPGQMGKDEGDLAFTSDDWKRSHFILANLMINVINIALIEFSFTSIYGEFFFFCFLLMKVLHITIEKIQEGFLKEAMLCLPASVGLTMTGGLVTISADDFTDFTMSFYLELIIGLGEYVFLDGLMAFVATQWPKLRKAAGNLYLRLRKKTASLEELEGQVVEEEEESVVEDLMGFLASYAVSSTALVMTPFYLYFYYDFNAQIQLSYLFGIRQKDLLIYLLFAGVIIIFQIVMDIIVFNTQELFHGWKVYEYMKYARYRFNHRTARWKGMETQFDESISPELRTVDQMCFSSQFYFILGMGGSGTFLFVLSISMMLRINYNMFKDPCFTLIIGLMLGACSLTQRLAIIVADVGGLWKIKGARGFGDNLIQETGELPFDLNEFRKQATDRDSTRRSGGTGEFSLDDITSESFRHKFLEHNRNWLLEQLSSLLTPRTAKRFKKFGGRIKLRGGLSDDEDSDEGEMRQFGEVKLTFAGQAVMRKWLIVARSRAPGRFRKHLAQLSESGTSDSEAEAARFGPVRLSPFASALVTGWLQSARQAKGTRKAKAIISDDSSSDSSSGSDEDTRFPPVVVSRAGRLVVQSWLHRSRVERKTKSAKTRMSEFGRALSTSGSDDSDLEGAAYRPPAIIKPSSNRLVRKWLENARIRRLSTARDVPGLGPRRRQGRVLLSSDSDSSDDDLPAQAAWKPARLSWNSGRVLAWWLQNLRRKRPGGG